MDEIQRVAILVWHRMTHETSCSMKTRTAAPIIRAKVKVEVHVIPIEYNVIAMPSGQIWNMHKCWTSCIIRIRERFPLQGNFETAAIE